MASKKSKRNMASDILPAPRIAPPQAVQDAIFALCLLRTRICLAKASVEDGDKASQVLEMLADAINYQAEAMMAVEKIQDLIGDIEGLRISLLEDLKRMHLEVALLPSFAGAKSGLTSPITGTSVAGVRVHWHG